MSPICKAFFGLRMRKQFVLFVFSFLFCYIASAQLVPGIRANGRPTTQGDTIIICIGSGITYLSTAQNFNALNWSFDVGTGIPITSTAVAPASVSVPYNVAGIFTSWQYIVAGGNRDSTFIYVKVNDLKPAAGFNFTPDNECGNVQVNFTSTSSGNGLSYNWIFESGNTSNLQNPGYQFLNAIGTTGTVSYPVKLVVTNDQTCKDSVTKTVTVKRIPDASIDRGATDFATTTFNGVPTFRKCDPVTSFQFRFLNVSTTTSIINSYTIKWGDGSPDSTFASWPANTIVAHTYPRGQSILQITANGTNGCIGIKRYYVFLGTNPSAGLETPGNTAVCNSSPNNQLTFPITGANNNASGTLYTIRVNDGSAQIVYQHPPPSSYTHTFTTTSCGTTSTDGTNSYPNAFSVNLTVSNPCLTSGATVTPIYITGKPRAQFVSPQNVCVSNSTYLYSNSNYGTVANGGTCTNNGKVAWVISPSTYTTSYTLGTYNPNYLQWQAGSTFLYVTFNQPGTYTIKMYAGNDANCGVDSITKTICVRTPPTASFVMNKKEGCAPDTVSIANTSLVGTCGGETYNWQVAYVDVQNCGTSSGASFIGGTSSSTRDAKIRFATPGRYIITLTETAVATGCISAVFRDTFYVKAKPKITLGALTAVCVGNTVSPTATVANCYSSQAATYNWTFTNGAPSTATTLNPGPVQFGAVGSYPVTLTAENECGISTATANATITNVPVANAGIDTGACSGVPVRIGVSTGNYTYAWSPATGLSNAAIANPNLMFTYTGPGADTLLTYVLTASAGTNCSSKDTIQVRIRKKPVVVVNPANATICGGGSTTLVASGATGGYNWSPATGLNFTNRDTVIASPANAITYTVTGIENGCTASAQVAVTVTALVKPDAGADTTVCTGSTSVQLTGTPSGGSWSGHSSLTSGGVFNAAAAGVGSFTLYYSTGSGVCVSKDSMVISVLSNPTASAGADTALCQTAGTIQLAGTPAGGTWSGSQLVTASGVFNTNMPGNYTLIYRIGGGSCVARDTATITINGGITNNLISANQSICSGGQPVQINGQPISGGNGAPQYIWEQSIDSLSWIAVFPQATGQNFTPPAGLTQTMFYRRKASTTLCAGAQTSISIPVKVSISPDAVAQFNPTATVGCVPFVITPAIINLTPDNNAISSYNWYVNGTLIGSGQAFPGYTINNAGDSITIKLVAISRYGCRNDSMQQGFKTITQPTPAFTQSDSVGCGPLSVTFTNATPNTGQYRYRWIFGNGQTSTLQQPPDIFFPPNPLSGDTVYTVQFKTITQCDTITLLRFVRVKSKPKALFTPDRTNGCSSYNFTFTNTSRGFGNSYVWDFGDGSPTLSTDAATVQHIYHTGSIDTFQVKLKAANECGTDSLVYKLVVQPITIRPDFAINGNERFGCGPHTVRFFNNSRGASSFRWDFGDGATLNTSANVDTVTHTYTQPGTFTIKMRATNNCSDTTDTELVTVYPKPMVSFTASPLATCFGDTLRTINTSDTGLVYNWRFGDGGTSILRSSTHVYTSGGTYRIWLRGTKAYPSGTGCADSAFQEVLIRDTLAGLFTASDTVASCIPAIITFKNSNRPAALTTWLFGDGSTATGDSIAHTYTMPGTYLVKMVSRGIAGCTYTFSKTITVTSPAGTVQYSSGYLCPGTPLRMQVAANAATQQIRYVFGDGDSLTTINTTVFHTYLQPGVYVPYAYVIAGSCQNRLSRTDTIRVDRLRTGFRTQQQQQCAATIVTFTDTSNAYFGIQSRRYDFGDGTFSTQQNPIKTYLQSGTYNVRLRIVGASGCVDTVTIPVVVAVRNYPVSTIGGDSTACIGQATSLAAVVQSADGIASYNWDFGNAVSGSGMNTMATYNQPGTYTIRLISRTGFGCADSVYKTIRVNTSPIINAGPDVRICRGQSIQLGATGAAAWQWTPLQYLSCTTCADPIASPLFTTSYIVTGSNNLLCKVSDTILVEVVQPFNLTVTPTTTLCIGDSVQLFATGAYTYAWTPPVSLDNPVLSNPIAKPNSTTVYQVVGKDRYNCFTDTDYVRVNVGRYPTVDLGTGGTVTAGTAINMNPVITNGPIARYTWTPATDLSCNNCPRPVATINKDIVYKLEVANNFGCTGSDTIIYRVNCTRDQLFIPNAFSPDGDGVNDVLMVRGKGIALVKYFRVFNRWGQLVFERSNVNANDPQQGWTGMVNGMMGQPDVYVWTVEALCTGGATFIEKGNVTLVR